MSELAKAYFRWFRGDSSFEWAEDQVGELFSVNEDSAWSITLALINFAPSKKCLSYVAAGQLEMLSRDCAGDIFERIKKEAQENNRVLYAMTGVWLSKEDPNFAEFYAFVKKEIAFREVEDLVDLPE